MPLTWIIDDPGATASNSSEAMRPAPVAPTWSPTRAIVMSTRPCTASIFGVNDTVVEPWRMNVPSWTLRTRTTCGLNVTVSDIVETRCALLIATGARYGPPAILNSVPAVVMITCAGVAVDGAAPGGPAGSGAFGSRGTVGSVTGGTPPGGVVGVPAGGTGGGWMPGRAAPPGGSGGFDVCAPA